MSEIEVEAIGVGYFGTIRNPGDRFTIPDVRALGSWMKRVTITREPKPKAEEKKTS